MPRRPPHAGDGEQRELTDGNSAPERFASEGAAWILAAVVAGVLLPADAAGVTLLLLALGRFGRRSGRRDLLLAAVFAGAGALFLVAAAADRPAGLDEHREEISRGFEELWTGLEERARFAASRLGEPGKLVPEARRAAFAELEVLAGDANVLLRDPDGAAWAWAGQGLLHEPEKAVEVLDPSEAGIAYRTGHSAATLVAVEPLLVEGRWWSVIAARSFSTEQIPFPGFRDIPDLAWDFADSMMEADTLGEPIHVGEGRPRIAVDLRHAVSGRGRPWEARAGVVLAIGCLLFLLAGVHLGTGRALEAIPLSWGLVAILATRDDWTFPSVTILSVGLTLAILAATRKPTAAGYQAWLLAGFLTAVVASAVFFSGRSLPLEASDAGWEGLGLRIGCLLALAGAWTLPSSMSSAVRDGGRFLLPLGSVSVLAASSILDAPLVGGLLLAVAGGILGEWWARKEEHGLDDILILGLLAALAAGSSWEAGLRSASRDSLVDYLALLAPPTDEELANAERELMEFFGREDLHPLLNPADPRVDGRDLAFELWKASPLPYKDGLSALVVEPKGEPVSSFSFGLGLDSDHELVPDPAGWQVPPSLEWTEAGVAGRVDLRRQGVTWARARFWWLPRPGFRLGVSEIEELGRNLVRGRPAIRGVDGLPPHVLYALYERDSGRALVSPWDESPPIDLEAVQEQRLFLETPSGKAWWDSMEGPDGLRVLLLPVLDPLTALETVGRRALGAAGVAGILLVVLVFMTYSGAQLRDQARGAVGSYSRRLILVTSGLLLVPLVALNLVLLRTYEERLHEAELAEGHRALITARRSLVDFLVGLEPGFGLDTLLDGRRLQELSEVVQHQVNFYWDGRVQASSQQELFTAGLLPARIPGEIYARLSLLGYRTATRTRSLAKPAYAELYAPLRLRGEPATGSGLFVSIPLLAREESVAEELSRLRSRAGLATLVLSLLLLGASSRLTRSFTRPLEELIDGTRRIARGARSAGVSPRDTELASLASAIDEMAERIARQREQLLREKELVDGIVENITSAVVSVDRTGCVALQNGTAARLLGTQVGEVLVDSLHGREELRPIGDLLTPIPTDLVRTSTRFPSGESDTVEWSVAWIPLPGESGPAGLLVVEDATDILRAERLEAWAEMARIIAHEIKNPLTPIRLSADHLRQVKRTAPDRLDEVFDRCIDNILGQVDELREIASEFSTFSRIPEAELAPTDLATIVDGLVEEYRIGGGATRIVWKCPTGPHPIRADEKLLRRGLRNLLENALRATEAGEGELEVQVNSEDGHQVVRVLDRGPGVRPDHLSRIFEPYFSTSEGGTGLGLAITRRIVEDHEGSIDARNRIQGGLEVRLSIPTAEDRS